MVAMILSAGIAAGMDMSLHVVAKLLGKYRAVKTANHLEYVWRPSEPKLAPPEAGTPS